MNPPSIGMLPLLVLAIVLGAHPQVPAQEGGKAKAASLRSVKFKFGVARADLDKPLAKLNAGYEARLKELQDTVRKAGKLDQTMAVKQELEGYAAGTGKPAQNFDELKRLQGIYASQSMALVKARAEKLGPLLESYHKRLAQLEVELTKADKLDEALVARAEATRIAGLLKDLGGQGLKTPETPRIAGMATASRDATKDKPFVNSLKMKFVPVPITGGPSDGKRILFSVWETRVGDYEKFIKADRERGWTRPSPYNQEDDHPAVYVAWEDAQAFCKWLTERDRKKGKLGKDEHYRLPSDHEWSCAVGIGKGEDADLTPAAKDSKIADVYPWGKKWPPREGAGNYYGEETKSDPIAGREAIKGFDDGFARTAPVGSFGANEYGLHDLGGNVWEWCADWYDPDDPGIKARRVMRGASWGLGNRDYLLSSDRHALTPGTRYNYYGFRCVVVR